MKEDKVLSALIKTDGKVYKGILCIDEDHYVLSDGDKTLSSMYYDISKTTLEEGQEEISMLGLFTTMKTFICFHQGLKVSDKLFIDERKVIDIFYDLKQKAEDALTLDDHALEDLKDVLLSNPYVVLGLPTSSTESQIDYCFEKIKKLIRINSLSAYRPECSLDLLPVPDRTLASCQNAINQLKNLDNIWLWFSDAKSSQLFQNYFSSHSVVEGIGLLDNKDRYDLFLSQYLIGLLKDSHFQNRQLWHEVFQFIEQARDHESNVIYDMASRWTTDEKVIRESFMKTLDSVAETVLKYADLNDLLRLYRTIRLDLYPALQNFKARIFEKMILYFKNLEDAVYGEISQYIGIGELSKNQMINVRDNMRRYDSNIGSSLPDVLRAFAIQPIKRDLVLESYKKVLNAGIKLLIAGNNKSEALKYANLVYPFENEATKQALNEIFGKENMLHV